MQNGWLGTRLLIAACIGCGATGTEQLSDELTEEDAALQAVRQPQEVSISRRAWRKSVNEAFGSALSYQEVQAILESSVGVSFALPPHVLRTDFSDEVDGLGNESFDLFFNAERPACAARVNYDEGAFVRPPPLDADKFCQIRPGRTTVGELNEILRDYRGLSCADVLSFDAQVFGEIVSYYAIASRTDPLENDVVTEFHSFDASGQLLLPTRCNRPLVSP